MAVDQALLERGYKGDEGTDAITKVMTLPPRITWEKFEETRSVAHALEGLSLGSDSATADNKALFVADSIAIVTACRSALKVRDDQPLTYLVTVLYNMLREDSSCYKIFEDATKSGVDLYGPMIELLKRPSLDKYIADKLLWILSALMGHQPRAYSIDKVAEFVDIAEQSACCSDLGRLESFVNLLKCEEYRVPLWKNHPGVHSVVLGNMKPSSSAQILYKALFATWMLSYSPQIFPDLKSGEANVIKKMKDILLVCRVEKVVRLSLTVLKNFLTSKAMCEDIVKEGLLEVVQSLEYEKWRDQELYDDIPSVASAISNEVKDLSSFERYSEELKSGALSWGYLHTSKFWAENVTKFDVDAVKELGMCLQSSDPTTLAVACHDIGEFVSLHPYGKRTVASVPSIKEKVMDLMASSAPEFREVRREALLCCQKIMLNKWQDVAADTKK